METPKWFADKCPGRDFEEFLGYTAWYAHCVVALGAPPGKQVWMEMSGREQWAWRSAAAAVYAQAELAASKIEI